MSETKYKAGDRIGHLVIINTSYREGKKRPMRRFVVKCDCGRVFECDDGKFRQEDPNCGCVKRIAHYSDMVGRVYGNLEVLEVVPHYQDYARLKCKCNLCGRITTPIAAAVKRGAIKACSCTQKNGLKAGTNLIQSSHKDGTSVFSLNQAVSKNNTSGYKGVSKYRNGKYRAYITFQRRQYYLGSYPTPEDAYEARKMAEQRIYGNFIEWYKAEYPDQWEKFEKSMKRKKGNK